MEGRTDKTRVEFIQKLYGQSDLQRRESREKKENIRIHLILLIPVLIHRLRLFYPFLPGLCGELLLNEIIYIYISYIFCIIIIIIFI